jgi:uncharacterized protein (UPF0333 family)
MNPLKLFFAQYKLYFILAFLAVLVIGTGTVVWKYRSAMADREIQQAVKQSVKDSQAKIDKAEGEAKMYKDLADGKYAELMDKVTNIKVVHTTVTNNIKTEVQGNPQFYNQPLPLKGWEQWLKARESFQQSSQQ